MNPSIRRRRRRTASPTSDLSLLNVLSDLTDNNPDTPRKRKRRTANSDNIDPNPQLLPPDTESSLTEPTEEIPADDATSFQPTPPASPNIYLQDQINLIRSEILDDEYHSQIADTNFTDDSHHWSDDSSQSDDYWHFLGNYE